MKPVYVLRKEVQQTIIVWFLTCIVAFLLSPNGVGKDFTHWD
jgi:hypothetical protein